MRYRLIVLCVLIMPGICATRRISAQTPPIKRIVIAASTLLDGKGHILHNTRIVVEGSKIVAIDSKAGPVDYDLRGLTVLPGWIDAHAHVTWIFGKDGKNAGQGGTTPEATYAAASNEAKKLGLRSLVHAYKDVVRAATLAGCTQIEHGTIATDDDLKLMAAKGTYLDPQAGLVIENYLLNKERYLGTPGYTPEGFVAMERVLSLNHELVQRASKTPGLKIVFGTDAVAGAHGRNAEEFIDRVRDGSVDPLTAMVSANSLGAEALGMGDQRGSIATGLQADIIALDGDPLKDITAVRRVVFVMGGGVVYKNVARGAIPAYAGVQP